MQKQGKKRPLRPKQEQQKRPGLEYRMTPRPQAEKPERPGRGKLEGKVAIITGGDSGIGRAVALAFAKEGADVLISYLNEHKDAGETKRLCESEGKRCEIIAGDIGEPKHCREIVRRALKAFHRLDILVNNAAEQHPQKDIQKISPRQLERTFRTNIFSFFFLVQAALPHLKKSSAIINTTSVTAYRGSPELLDYSSTKGAIVAFTRSLSHALVKKGIRVNGVAPGPIWTPLIPSTFPGAKVETFGSDAPMGRAGQPSEVAPCYVFLASSDSSYMTGQILHPN
ncbi:MAG TPA: SDR family oxidoreductase, partial [Methylomirabilota bacterium]|nr:SDR family oxidoreductase [Methylomirabilota bacterium]